eukprot:6207849-Pleurochrysis_carterae.AAC.2
MSNVPLPLMIVKDQGVHLWLHSGQVVRRALLTVTFANLARCAARQRDAVHALPRQPSCASLPPTRRAESIYSPLCFPAYRHVLHGRTVYRCKFPGGSLNRARTALQYRTSFDGTMKGVPLLIEHLCKLQGHDTSIHFRTRHALLTQSAYVSYASLLAGSCILTKAKQILSSCIVRLLVI